MTEHQFSETHADSGCDRCGTSYGEWSDSGETCPTRVERGKRIVGATDIVPDRPLAA
jgi:hypothetical protein